MPKMPVLFVGHGSPMNAIEDNEYSRAWTEIGRRIPKPEAVLSISAHWFTDGTRVTDDPRPRTVYDMYGFPDELYRVQYRPNGAPELARRVAETVSRPTSIDNGWGCDHGTWSVLRRMYPEADVPTFQLGIDRGASAEEHFRIGRELGALRDEGVLILGSGNVVHNLSRVDWNMEGGHPWADEFDGYVEERVTRRSYEEVLDYRSAGKCSELAFSTPEHFDPLLYVLGASRNGDSLFVFNDSRVMGSLSMTGYLFE
jgi:4,5-DOPA dioxygenase extradiol